jgi:chromosome segregation ATPase
MNLCAFRHDFTVKKKALEEIEARMKTVKEKLSQKKQDAQRAKLEANERAPLIDDDGEDTELKEKLDVDLGHFDYIEQAEASLEEVQERINNTVEDANVIRNYEQMQRELNTTEAQLDALTRGKEQRRTDMLLIAEPWETSLERILTKVDSRFSRYMDELGCVGAVRLRKGDANAEEEEARYADYAVEILVSFRDGVAPTVLSAQVQSGGERSVSTIMYLMAMQVS